jgi:thiamine-phosphate pyrophosphorylase
LLLYYITDRTQFPGDENTRRRTLLDKIAEAARSGMDLIQLREKDLSTRDLEALASAAVRIVHEASRLGAQSPRTRVLINSRTDVAIACGADGVHLRSDDISAQEVRKIWDQSPRRSLAPALVSVSCHNVADVARAAAQGADFAVLAPIFEKKDAPNAQPMGLEALHGADLQKIPVLALGGITRANARSCMESGASGIAAIRLFQENNIAEVVRGLRG